MNDHIDPASVPAEGNGTALAARRDFYGELGLAPFESDGAVISSKVRDLMREARKYQLGPNAARTQTRLDELAAAAACLLDPGSKRSYDDELRRQYGLPPIAVLSTYVPRAIADAESGAKRSPDSKWRTLVPLAAALSVAAVVAVVTYTRPGGPHSTQAVEGHDSKVPAAVAKVHVAAEAEPCIPRQRTLRSRRHVRAPDETPEGEPATIRRPEETATSVPARLPAGHVEAASPLCEPAGTRRAEAPPIMVHPFPEAMKVPPKPASVADDSGNPTKRGGGAAPAPATQANAPANAAPEPALHLTAAEVLRELKDIRLSRTPAARIAADPRLLGGERIVELVRYGRTSFADDRKFQRLLDQEVLAMKRLYPMLRDKL